MCLIGCVRRHAGVIINSELLSGPLQELFSPLLPPLLRLQFLQSALKTEQTYLVLIQAWQDILNIVDVYFFVLWHFGQSVAKHLQPLSV